ncbi:hypothetical protein GCM10010377_57180 [Streptomyces viridiviolaceus]|nr:hypothetical protein GCM10010377_57180 [Streptomyces viridiviolaceus]
MNGITLTLRVLHRGERHLAQELVTVAERHRVEHEVHHVATDLAVWSRAHVRRLAETAAGRGLDLSAAPDHDADGVFATLRKKASEAMGRRPATGLLLLRDLREPHVAATENSLHREMLARSPRHRGTANCWSWPPPATRRHCARCAGPTP